MRRGAFFPKTYKIVPAADHLCTLDATPTAAQACSGDSGSPVIVQRAAGGWASEDSYNLL